jgi:hypothetical protein
MSFLEFCKVLKVPKNQYFCLGFCSSYRNKGRQLNKKPWHIILIAYYIDIWQAMVKDSGVLGD